MNRFNVAALGMLLTLFVTLFAQPAIAADPVPLRVVVLQVAGDGDDRVAAKVAEIEGVEVRDQAWFVKQVKQRGIKTKGLMRRPKDLKWVMQGAEVTRLVFFEDEDTSYTVNLIGQNGEVSREFKMDKVSGTLDDASVDIIVKELQEDMGIAPKPVVVEETKVDVKPEQTKVEPPKVEPEPASGLYGSQNLSIEVFAKLNKRDLGVNGANGAVLTYPSQFYPGGGLNLTYLPGSSESSTGVVAGVMVGMASVAAAADPGQTAESKSLLHLEGKLLLDHRVLVPTAVGGRSAVRFDFLAGAKYTAFSVDQGALPSTSTVFVVLGASASKRALADGLTLRGRVELLPFGTWLGGAENYGESPVGYGFGAGLGGDYALSDSLGLVFGYDLSFQRTSFSGQGTQDYLDAEAFELVQGLTLGVVYAN
ncbi:MAG: hypothetical protein R3E66_15470 [bacterium]